MSEGEAIIGVITFFVVLIIIGYAAIFDRLPEPVQGWRCSLCKRKWIGMKQQMDALGWRTEEPYVCPECRSDNRS